MSRISLMVGHKADAPGAFAGPPISMYEYEFNTGLAQHIMSIMKQEYTIQVFFRDGFNIVAAYQELDKWNPDVNIELHFNSSEDPKAQGTETLCLPRSRVFAQIIQDVMCRSLQRDLHNGDRGIKILKEPLDRGFTSVNQLRCPNILIEPFFGSSPEDCSRMLGGIENFSSAICLGIEHYLGLT